MAVVGDAYVIVHAITRGVPNDIRNGFRDADRIGMNAGRQVGQGFRRGLTSGGGGLFGKDFVKEAEGVYDSLSNLITVGYFLGPALAGIASAASSVVGGLAAMAAQAAAAGPALLGLIGVFSALIQAAAAVKIAFIGVGAAISAGLKAGGGGGGGDSGAAAEAAAKRVEDARRRLAMAIENAAEVEERAARAVQDAWESYQDSVIETSKAVDRLRQAQKDAAEQTQQLGFDVEDAALAQQQAAMDLEDARMQLAAVSDLPVDSRARQEAELAFKQAELEYRRAVDRSGDLQQQQDEAAAAGSAGAQQIADAAQGVVDAKKNEADQFVAYQDAIIAAERAHRDSMRQIADAERELKDALDALKKGFGGAAGGADAFAQAMAKLSPEARAFVYYILSIQDELKKLQFAAGRELFPQLISAIDNLVKNLFPRLIPLLEGTGKALGSAAIELSRTVTEANNLRNLERIWKTNDKVIGEFGKTLGNVLSVILDLLDAARPLTLEFANWARGVSDSIRDLVAVNKASGNLARTLEYSSEVAKQLGRIFYNLAAAFYNIGKAAAGPGSGGEMIFNALEGMTRKFRAWTDDVNNSRTMVQYFKDVADNFIAIGRAVAKAVIWFAKLGDNKSVQAFFDKISQSGGAIDQLGAAFERLSDTDIASLFGDIVNNIAEVVQVLTDTGALKNFFNILKSASDILVNVFRNQTVVQVIAFAAGFMAIVKAFRLLYKIAALPFKYMVGAISKVTKIGGGLLTLFSNIRMYIGFIAMAFNLSAGSVIAIAGGVVLAIAAIIGVFVGMYTQSEIFRNSISNLVSAIGGALVGALDTLKTAFSEAFAFLDGGSGAGAWQGFLDILKTVGDFIGNYIVPIIRDYLVFNIKMMAAIVGIVVRLIGAAIQSIVSIFQGMYEGVRPYIDQFIALWDENVGPVIETVVSWFQDNLAPAFSTSFDVIGTAITNFANFVQPVFNMIGQVIGWLFGNVLVTWFKLAIAQIKILAAAISWLWTNIFQPVFNAIGNYITTYVVPAYMKLWEGFQAVLDLLSPVFALFASLFRVAVGVVRTAIGAIVALFTVMWTGWQILWNKVSGAWSGTGQPLIDKVKSAINTALTIIGGLWDKYIGAPFRLTWEAAKSFWDNTVYPFLSGLAGKISEIAGNMWSGLANGLSAAVSTVKSVLNALIIGWNSIIDKINSVPGVPYISPIPTLALGGVVRPRAGGTLVRVAEAGQAERVEPLDSNGLSQRDKAMIAYLTRAQPAQAATGAVTVNVYPSEGMSETALAEKVSRTIRQQMRKGLA